MPCDLGSINAKASTPNPAPQTQLLPHWHNYRRRHSQHLFSDLVAQAHGLMRQGIAKLLSHSSRVGLVFSLSEAGTSPKGSGHGQAQGDFVVVVIRLATGAAHASFIHTDHGAQVNRLLIGKNYPRPHDLGPLLPMADGPAPGLAQ